MEMQESLFPGSEIPHQTFYMASQPLDPYGLFFQVHRAGETKKTPSNFSIARTDAYAYNAIHCITSGRGQLALRNATHDLAPGQIFMLPASEAHEYHSDPETPLGLSWVEFCGSNSTELMHFIIDQSPVLSDTILFPQVLSLCRNITTFQRSSVPQRSQILYQMLMLLCSDMEETPAHRPLFSSILAYIDEHFCETLLLEQVARRFGYHPNYFSTLFSSSTGTTFVKYITNRRMAYAADLLKKTVYPVTQISEKCGYSDISNFYRHFQRQYGMSPAAFRRSKSASASVK